MNFLKEKSFKFAVRVVKLSQYLGREKREYVMSKQILRSGTAVGALYREAEHAESKADFIHKLAIAQKECNETIYWLELLHATEYLTQPQFDSLYADAVELIKLLTSSIKTAKSKG
ncbi:four helix bundle protein [Anaerolineales bacterium HSG24]|nr:four helix bundle protein [Anaerolineales bacterium HSG24]